MEPRPDGATVLREAQEWVQELRNAGWARRLEFAHWIKYSPEHVKAYLMLTCVETELSGIRDTNELDLESVLSWLSTTVVVLPGGSESPEINRYHREKVVIADPALEQVKIGGTIDPSTNDYRVIVRALSNTCPIDIDDTDPSIVRLRRNRAPNRCSPMK
jgi:ferric-dicitrate binding protein FerR (iron transport regulator)